LAEEAGVIDREKQTKTLKTHNAQVRIAVQRELNGPPVSGLESHPFHSAGR